MKRLFTTLFFASILIAAIQMAKAVPAQDSQQPAKITVSKMQSSEEILYDESTHPIYKLEDELKLNDNQKEKAKALRIKARQEMKPIINQIREKREEILNITDSNLTQEQQQEKIKPILNDLKKLHKQAYESRKKNLKEFGKILSRSQKAKFESIKRKYPVTGCKYCPRKAPLPPLPHEE